jgi:hypothetical protein
MGFADVAEEFVEREGKAAASSKRLIGLDVRETLEANHLINVGLEGGEERRHGEPPSAIPSTQPVHREISDHGHEPSRHRGRATRLSRVASEASKVVGRKRLANRSIDVHKVVTVRDQALDGSEYQPTIAGIEQIPRGLRVAFRELC